MKDSQKYEAGVVPAMIVVDDGKEGTDYVFSDDENTVEIIAVVSTRLLI